MKLKNDLYSQDLIALVAIVVSLVCVFFTEVPLVGGFFSVLILVVGTIYASNTIRIIGASTITKQGNSIDYLLTACGCISSLAGTSLSVMFDLKYLFPLFSILVAAFSGYMLVLIMSYILKVDDKIMTKSFISISVSSMICSLGMATFICSSYATDTIYTVVMKSGYTILQIILILLIKQLSYNATKGPNEDQKRTITLAVAYAFLSLIALAIISIPQNPYWIIDLSICIIGCYICIKKFIKFSKHQAASVRYHGFYQGNKSQDKGDLKLDD